MNSSKNKWANNLTRPVGLFMAAIIAIATAAGCDMSSHNKAHVPAAAVQEESPTGLGWKESYLGGSPAAEQQFIKQAEKDINEIQAANKKTKNASSYKRGFHAKMDAGFTNAQFRIMKDIPPQLAIGMFQPGKSYATKVRFSNATGTVEPDRSKDLRGLALKVKTDIGEQDFLVTNAQAGFAHDARQFMNFGKAFAGPQYLAIPKLIQSEGPFETFRILQTAIPQVSRPVASLVTESYFSRAPYALGEKALQFEMSPSEVSSASLASTGDNYLHDDLAARLKKGPVVLNFCVRLFRNEKSTPIEDGTVAWDSPQVTIAQLIIPQQDLNSAKAIASAKDVDKLQFNPWNCTKGFRPLGNFNRFRQSVYKASAKKRQGDGK